jgi:phage tail sheath gpL-like
VAASLAATAAWALLADPARQLEDLALAGITPPQPADRFTPDEQNLLLHDGLATYDVRVDGVMTIQRLITTYLVTNAGFADTAWLDVMVPKVMTRIRYDWRAYVKTVWPSAKLTDDGSLAAEYDDTIATPKRLQASWLARSILYEKQGWIEGAAALAQTAVFERDPNNRNRVICRLPVRIVGNLITLDAALEFQV